MLKPSKQEKEAEIARKCANAGCDKKKKERHYQLFVHERWDPHPDPDFQEFFQSHPQRMDVSSPIAWWNTDSVRQEFYKWRGRSL